MLFIVNWGIGALAKVIAFSNLSYRTYFNYCHQSGILGALRPNLPLARQKV